MLVSLNAPNPPLWVNGDRGRNGLGEHPPAHRSHPQKPGGHSLSLSMGDGADQGGLSSGRSATIHHFFCEAGSKLLQNNSPADGHGCCVAMGAIIRLPDSGSLLLDLLRCSQEKTCWSMAVQSRVFVLLLLVGWGDILLSKLYFYVVCIAKPPFLPGVRIASHHTAHDPKRPAATRHREEKGNHLGVSQ